jgi:hypothetical protein
MAFGRWYPLGEAAAHAPAGPGVFQVRLAHGLIAYPTGRSAMVHYGSGEDVRQAVADLARAHAGRDWLCRFADPATTPQAAAAPGTMVAELVSVFRRRFGAPPGFPE